MPRHSKKPRTLIRKVLYLVVMIATGGGAGAAFRNHPVLRAAYELVVGKDPAPVVEPGELKSTLTSTISRVLKPDDARQPGVYRVTINEIRLDPKMFRDGRTVDLQARVLRVGADGREATVWRSEEYGENLSVVGRDDLSAAFTNRPFELAWTPGDRVVVEVWDRRSGLFDRKDLKMAYPEPGVFPLASGPHALEFQGRPGPGRDSELNRIVFESKRLRDSGPRRDGDSATDEPRQLAERPIIIK